jgi:toxin ParE1/3/4
VTRFILHPAARQDMSEIWLYTADKWGVDQADSYIRQIETDMRRAFAFPEAGSTVTGLPTAYRKLPTGSHRIIYSWSGHAITVLRILHERQDLPEDWPE